MPAIQLADKYLLLGLNTQLSLTRNSSWLMPEGQNGSYSLPFKAPFSDDYHNAEALGFPERFDHAGRPPRRYEPARASDEGHQLASGQLVLQSIETDGYQLNMITDISAAMSKLKAKKLKDFYFGGEQHIGTENVSNWGQLSDVITAHMLDVVDNPNLYNYRFAPFSNNDAYADHDDDKTSRWCNMNQWLNSGFVVHNGYDNAQKLDPATITSCVPLPRLEYVVRQIFEELGIPMQTDLFDDPEIRELVLINNVPVENNGNWFDWFVGRYQVVTVKFRIGNQLPDLTAAEFIRRIANTFYLDIYQDTAGVVQLRRTNKLATAQPAQDLTEKLAPGFTREAAELTVKATYDTSDGWSAKYLQEINPDLLSDPVARQQDLPSFDLPNAIRLVQDRNFFMQFNGNRWVSYSFNYPPVVFGDPAAEEFTDVPQGIAVVFDGNIPPEPGNIALLRTVIMGEKAYSLINSQGEKSKSIRLAFYRGGRPRLGTFNDIYPMLSTGNLDPNEQQLGQRTLYLSGEYGLVKNYGQFYLQMLGQQPAKFKHYLSGAEFQNLSLGETVSVRGDVFMVRTLSITLPTTQAGTIELVPRPSALLS